MHQSLYQQNKGNLPLWAFEWRSRDLAALYRPGEQPAESNDSHGPAGGWNTRSPVEEAEMSPAQGAFEREGECVSACRKGGRV